MVNDQIWRRQNRKEQQQKTKLQWSHGGKI